MLYERLQCCDELSLLDLSKMEVPGLRINFTDPNLWVAALCIGFNPLFWNVVARWEYRTHKLSRLFGSPYIGCYVLAVMIFFLGIYRDGRYRLALQSQPKSPELFSNWILWSGYVSVLVGSMLVLTSFFTLGVTGTFLGDYFGILLDEKVTSFPFNIMDNPMYWGSTMNFFGVALIQASHAGLLLTLWVAVSYKIVIMFEGPFTEAIYSKKTKLKSNSHAD